jgi:hypothetical protein
MVGKTTNPPGSAELEKVAETPPTVSVNVVEVEDGGSICRSAHAREGHCEGQKFERGGDHVLNSFVLLSDAEP